MKRKGHLYEEIINFDNIKNNYQIIRKNTRNKGKIYKFELYYTYNITRLKQSLENKTYKMGKYNIFLIQKPKYRIIMGQEIRDKIANHLVANNVLVNVLDKSLIDANVATRKNKGTIYGIKKLKQYLSQLTNSNDDIYALKFDIAKYFYHIDHHILMDKIKKKIKDTDVINLIQQILDSTNEEYVNLKIENLKKKELDRIDSLKLSPHEKNIKSKEIMAIPIYEKDKGLPIGNMTSQILAIFYLNDLDHYIKEHLKSKHYIRYMDDGIILSNDKTYLKDCYKEIKDIVKFHKLELNNKTKIVNVTKEGLEFLGYRFIIKNKKIIMKIRNSTKKRFKKKIKNGNLDVISSYKGLFKIGNCHNLFMKYVNRDNTIKH